MAVGYFKCDWCLGIFAAKHASSSSSVCRKCLGTACDRETTRAAERVKVLKQILELPALWITGKMRDYLENTLSRSREQHSALSKEEE